MCSNTSTGNPLPNNPQQAGLGVEPSRMRLYRTLKRVCSPWEAPAPYTGRAGTTRLAVGEQLVMYAATRMNGHAVMISGSFT